METEKVANKASVKSNKLRFAVAAAGHAAKAEARVTLKAMKRSPARALALLPTTDGYYIAFSTQRGRQHFLDWISYSGWRRIGRSITI